MAKNISFTIKYWKQNGPKDAGHFDSREMHNIPDDTSFLEMLDILNEELSNEGKLGESSLWNPGARPLSPSSRTVW